MRKNYVLRVHIPYRQGSSRGEMYGWSESNQRRVDKLQEPRNATPPREKRNVAGERVGRCVPGLLSSFGYLGHQEARQMWTALERLELEREEGVGEVVAERQSWPRRSY